MSMGSSHNDIIFADAIGDSGTSDTFVAATNVRVANGGRRKPRKNVDGSTGRKERLLKNGQQGGARSLPDVAADLTDLSDLPEPVFEGGITRVVVPQDIYEKELQKEEGELLLEIANQDGTGRDKEAVAGTMDTTLRGILAYGNSNTQRNSPTTHVNQVMLSDGSLVVTLDDVRAVDEVLAENAVNAKYRDISMNKPYIIKSIKELQIARILHLVTGKCKARRIVELYWQPPLSL
ncbi:hypothetical protein NE237_007857 [Protea cynaroides]|uniref:Uncharacterized protein n=1 Tax=Protea cynaroides TaxID=273540 RepID=A0A9Q0QWK1_9MAGN|nr:hypothetical protein NE237_007857 [Protea cynaroides]